jgi:hypothetical protein
MLPPFSFKQRQTALTVDLPQSIMIPRLKLLVVDIDGLAQ